MVHSINYVISQIVGHHLRGDPGSEKKIFSIFFRLKYSVKFVQYEATFLFPKFKL